MPGRNNAVKMGKTRDITTPRWVPITPPYGASRLDATVRGRWLDPPRATRTQEIVMPQIVMPQRKTLDRRRAKAWRRR